jgi:hypothetical protein
MPENAGLKGRSVATYFLVEEDAIVDQIRRKY